MLRRRNERRPGEQVVVRAMFIIYSLVIVSGIAFCVAVGFFG